MAPGPLLLFDGVCNLCNRSVQFVIRHDKKKIFRFAPLQGESAKRILAEMGIKETLPEQGGSVFLIHRGQLFNRSAAVLETLWLLGGPWKLFYAAVIVPVGLRDKVYAWIARNRYRWFGRRDACMVPPR